MPKTKKKTGSKKFLRTWTRINVIIEDEQLAEIDAVAYKGRGRSDLIRALCKEGLERRAGQGQQD